MDVAALHELRIDSVSVVYDSDRNRQVHALHEVSIDLARGSVLCLLGPSGCGKSTLLRCIAGLIPPTSGSISVRDNLVRGTGPDRGMVFQEAGLFPWLSVERNIEFGLRYLEPDARKRKAKVEELIEVVQLEGFEGARPAALSGGMKQRVAIARALAADPALLLLDEPFGALDAQTRLRMQYFLRGLIEREGRTAVFVTHDIDEAILMGDQIAVMSARPGRITEDMPSPFPKPRTTDIYEDPRYGALKSHILKLLKPTEEAQ